MGLVERQYNLVDFANVVVPLVWVALASRFHFPAWLALTGFLLLFILVNYRVGFHDSVPPQPPPPQRQRRIYFQPGFWFVLALIAYLAYLVMRSGWFLWTLLISGTLGILVAVFLRWKNRVPADR